MIIIIRKISLLFGTRICPWMKQNLMKKSCKVLSKLVFCKWSVQKAKRHNGGTAELKQQSESG